VSAWSVGEGPSDAEGGGVRDKDVDAGVHVPVGEAGVDEGTEDDEVALVYAGVVEHEVGSGDGRTPLTERESLSEVIA
jgi:hypothetical protein